MVEHHLAKVGVASSNLVSRSIKKLKDKLFELFLFVAGNLKSFYFALAILMVRLFSSSIATRNAIYQVSLYIKSCRLLPALVQC